MMTLAAGIPAQIPENDVRGDAMSDVMGDVKNDVKRDMADNVYITTAPPRGPDPSDLEVSWRGASITHLACLTKCLDGLGKDCKGVACSERLGTCVHYCA